MIVLELGWIRVYDKLMIECEIDDCYVWIVELFVDFMMLMIGAMFMHKLMKFLNVHEACVR